MKPTSGPTGLSLLRLFAEDAGGATAVEYSLMAGLVSLAIMGVVQSLGQAINTDLYGHISDALASK